MNFCGEFCVFLSGLLSAEKYGVKNEKCANNGRIWRCLTGNECLKEKYGLHKVLRFGRVYDKLRQTCDVYQNYMNIYIYIRYKTNTNVVRL